MTIYLYFCSFPNKQLLLANILFTNMYIISFETVSLLTNSTKNHDDPTPVTVPSLQSLLRSSLLSTKPQTNHKNPPDYFLFLKY